ncbi:uncharacterized protein LOC113672088 [Pocillopora damicornis]|uniref:uncharacterized protein LOC113672088 n=1 Tax=Pocillopora damicornis TaxID=46731 RepID=UPI000F54E17D|nr:uncharacterized protein LOC113672088 [Pocillopora damicornis]
MLKRTSSTGFTPSVVAVDQREDVEDPRDWDVQRVKVWAKALFNDEGIARKFEEEEIEGRTLQSERILSDSSMDNLGLSTIGKKDKFATAVQDLFGKFIKVTIMIIQKEKNPTTEDVTKDSSVIVISDDDEEMKNASNDPPNILSATKTPTFQLTPPPVTVVAKRTYQTAPLRNRREEKKEKESKL